MKVVTYKSQFKAVIINESPEWELVSEGDIIEREPILENEQMAALKEISKFNQRQFELARPHLREGVAININQKKIID